MKTYLFIGAIISFILLSTYPSSAQIISTIAGRDSIGFYVDGVQATSTFIGSVYDIQVDKNLNIYFANNDLTIKKINSGGITSTITAVTKPIVLALDQEGNFYTTDGHNCIKRIDTFGNITIFAGSPYFTGYNGDGIAATAALLSHPIDLAFDRSGNLYIVDGDNNRIRKVSGGVITTVAGNGFAANSGDGGAAIAASVARPLSVAVDSLGNLYIGNDSMLRKVDASGIITTIAGPGVTGLLGDGGPATAANFNVITSIALEKHGNIFVCDYLHHTIRLIDPNGYISVVPDVSEANPVLQIISRSVNGIHGTEVEIFMQSRFLNTEVQLHNLLQHTFKITTLSRATMQPNTS
jgi:hypothetical protein